MPQLCVFEIKNISSMEKPISLRIFSNDISFNGKSESHIKTLGGITITKLKWKRPVLMIRELLRLEYLYARFNHTTEREVNLKLSNFLHA